MSTDRNVYRDRHGKRLDEYPRPSVAVDAALLTLAPADSRAQLSVLQVRREDGRGWGLPGTFIHPGERLIDAVQRSLQGKAGVHGLRPRQLGVFDDPKRDDRGWVLSVAHVDVVPVARLSGRHSDRTRIVPAGRPGRIPYDHAEIIDLAIAELRGRYRERPDPDRLLPSEFTLRELRLTHEAVLGEQLQRDSFRRSMQRHLAPTRKLAGHGPGRPAELFRRGADELPTWV